MVRPLVLALALFGSALVSRSASAAEAPAREQEDEAPVTRRGPIEEPADWIAVAGIVCYSVVPVLVIITVTVLTYRFFAGDFQSALLSPWERSDWLFRGAAGATIARPPPGIVLLRF